MGDSLHNLVVLITGASSGIGAGCAVEFAKIGTRLVLIGRNRERLEETARECVAHGLAREKIFLTTGDLRNEEDCASIVQDSVEYFDGLLDVLVNNAGEPCRKNIYTAEIEDLDVCHETNLKSVFMMTKLSLPYLVKTKGTIINMSSVSGLRPLPPSLPYSTVKCAVDHFTKICASSPRVAGKGIRVNSVNPGAVLTPLFTGPNGLFGGDAEKLKKWHAQACKTSLLGRIGEVDEVARIVVFLASKEAGYLSGTLFPMEGGFSNTSYIPKTENNGNALITVHFRKG